MIEVLNLDGVVIEYICICGHHYWPTEWSPVCCEEEEP